MSLLSLAKRSEVIAHLCEGAGVRATSRLTDVSKPTILALLLKVGAGCDRLHDRLVRDLDIRELQVDELWSFIQKKASRVKPEDPSEWGDAYTYLALARTQKLIVSYRVGKRDATNADAFMRDLRARLVTVPQLSVDGFGPYPAAVGQSFEAVDLGVVQKNYSRSPRRVRDGMPSDHRYEPPRDPFCVRRAERGIPDPARISTSHVERLNLDVRMQTRRMTRLCNGFSRSLKHHAAAVSLFVAFHNFCRVHGALRVTPGMEAGLVSSLWSAEDLVEAALEVAGEAVAPPERKPLRMPERPGVRPLANGGFLRLVTGSGSPAPAPAPPAPLAMPPTAAPAPVADETGQLDLFSWRPSKREEWEQLTLFD